MDAPVAGPIPAGKTREDHFALPLNNPAGRVDELHIDEFAFDRQYHQLANRRYFSPERLDNQGPNFCSPKQGISK